MICPWCRRGEIILHGHDEPWMVTVHDEGAVGYQAKGGRPRKVRAPRIPWFSCSACAVDGTQQFLHMMVSGALRRYLHYREALRTRAELSGG